MAEFSKLPNEMVSEIWGHIVEPTDVESFALVSKNVHAIGRPFVEEHRNLTREYSSFEFDILYDSPALVLKEVLLRPRVALYVTHLAVSSNGDFWEDLVDGDEFYSDDNFNLFIEAVRKTSFVPRNDVPHWITRVTEGDRDPIFALLCLLLPNLTTITLQDQEESADLFPKTIQRIAKAEKKMFLAHLRTVDITFTSGNDHQDLEWMKMFATLPHVQSIHVQSMGVIESDDLIDDGRLFVPDQYDLGEITFTKSGLRSKVLCQLLQSIKALRIFSYEEPDERYTPFEPFWMRVSLLAHAKHSLESLKILYPKMQEGELLGSLREFTALKKLETNIRLLIRAGEIDKLAKQLPASIEIVDMHNGDFGRFELISGLVMSITKAKSLLIPNLRVLKIRTGFQIRDTLRGRQLIRHLKEMCQGFGIELTIRKT